MGAVCVNPMNSSVCGRFGVAFFTCFLGGTGRAGSLNEGDEGITFFLGAERATQEQKAREVLATAGSRLAAKDREAMASRDDNELNRGGERAELAEHAKSSSRDTDTI